MNLRKKKKIFTNRYVLLWLNKRERETADEEEEKSQ